MAQTLRNQNSHVKNTFTRRKHGAFPQAPSTSRRRRSALASLAAYADDVLRFILILIPVAITIYALIDAISARRDAVRSLPKWLWIVLIIILWIGGAVLWFFFGRPSRSRGADGAPGGSGQSRPQGPDDDADFLADLDWQKRKNKGSIEPAAAGDQAEEADQPKEQPKEKEEG